MTGRSRKTPEELRARVAAMRADLRRRRQEKPDRRRRRRWWPWLLLLLLLLLLLRLCSCSEAPPPLPEPVAPAPTGPAGTGEVTPPAPVPQPGRIPRRDRSEYANDAHDQLPWVTAFRMQVAARAPRLAECFVGADNPGALKWTAAVEPVSGRVSDHTLEPAGVSSVLTADQRTCVLGVLSDPPYRLEAGAGRSTPPRVGMTIEF